MKKLALFLFICVLTGTLSGCGGGSGTTSSAPSTVTGVATPGAISVVTAK